LNGRGAVLLDGIDRDKQTLLLNSPIRKRISLGACHGKRVSRRTEPAAACWRDSDVGLILQKENNINNTLIMRMFSDYRLRPALASPGSGLAAHLRSVAGGASVGKKENCA
jgi:hypothetical protein